MYKPPMDKVINQESSRNDRKTGIAQQDYLHFYRNKEFDLMLDTSNITPQAATELIRRKLLEQSCSCFRI